MVIETRARYWFQGRRDHPLGTFGRFFRRCFERRRSVCRQIYFHLAVIGTRVAPMCIHTRYGTSCSQKVRLSVQTEGLGVRNESTFRLYCPLHLIWRPCSINRASDFTFTKTSGTIDALMYRFSLGIIYFLPITRSLLWLFQLHLVALEGRASLFQRIVATFSSKWMVKLFADSCVHQASFMIHFLFG